MASFCPPPYYRPNGRDDREKAQKPSRSPDVYFHDVEGLTVGRVVVGVAGSHVRVEYHLLIALTIDCELLPRSRYDALSFVYF